MHSACDLCTRHLMTFTMITDKQQITCWSLVTKICLCPTKSQLWWDMICGQFFFFYRKSFCSKGEYKSTVSKSYSFWWCPTRVCFLWPRWCLSRTHVLSLEKISAALQVVFGRFLPSSFIWGSRQLCIHVSYLCDVFWWKRVHKLAKPAPRF